MGCEQHEGEEMTFVWMNPLIQILQSELDHSLEVKSQFPFMKYFQHDALLVPFDLHITEVMPTRALAVIVFISWNGFKYKENLN